MINAEAFGTARANCPADEQTFCLRKNVAAIQVLPEEARESPRLGMITQLPHGAELAVCGPGFNERTVKVRWSGGMYFVFLQDLETPLAFTAAS